MRILVLIVVFDAAASPYSVYRTVDALGNCFHSATRSWMLAFGYTRYGFSTIATAGLLVLIGNFCALLQVSGEFVTCD